MSFDAQESSTYGAAPFELYWFTMGDVEWCITSGEEPRIYLGRVFSPSSITSDEIELSKETTSGTMTVTVPVDSEIAAEFLAGLPPKPVWLNKYEGHDGDAEILNTFSGRIAKATFKDDCEFVVSGEGQALRKKIPGPVYQQSCNRRLYTPACGAAEAFNTFTLVVGSVSADGLTVDFTGNSDPDTVAFIADMNTNWVRIQSGETPALAVGRMKTADGRVFLIEDQPTAGTIKLKQKAQGLAAGDHVDVSRGCRRTIKHCKFYGRTHRFFGFDIMPTKNPSSDGVA